MTLQACLTCSILLLEVIAYKVRLLYLRVRWWIANPYSLQKHCHFRKEFENVSKRKISQINVAWLRRINDKMKSFDCCDQGLMRENYTFRHSGRPWGVHYDSRIVLGWFPRSCFRCRSQCDNLRKAFYGYSRFVSAITFLALEFNENKTKLKSIWIPKCLFWSLCDIIIPILNC